MIKFNYHTHTKRCGHATGEDEEYVIKAIELGYEELGFSDHIMIPGLSQKGIRGEYEEIENYIESINNLKKKYSDRIKIFCGFECEYFEQYADYYKELINRNDVDYFILGQHFYFNDNNEINNCMWRPKNKVEAEKKYIELVIKGISSGLFKYVAHPDVFMTMESEWNETCIDISKRLCEAAIKYDIPIEINLCQTRFEDKNKWVYPRDEFWKIASEYGVKVVIGADAHYPEMLKEVAFDRAFDLVKKYKLNYLEKIEI